MMIDVQSGRMERAGAGVSGPSPALTTSTNVGGWHVMAEFQLSDPAPPEIAECPVCGSAFSTRIPGTKLRRSHCSLSCAVKAQHRKRESRGPSNPNWKGGPVEKSCERCGGSFVVKYTRREKARFCTLACFNEWQREAKVRYTNFDLARLRVGPPRKKFFVACHLCFRAYPTLPSRLGKVRFCSARCQSRWRSSRFGAEGNPNWNGGISRLPYTFDWRSIARAIRARDGDRCRSPLCEGHVESINVHHIDYDKRNCDPSNLIALCAACNGRANFNRQWWRDLYVGLMRGRGMA